MRRGTKKRHNIDILFQMVVFMLFTFSAITLLVLSIHFYRSTVERGEKGDSARVAVAYIREIIHQNDGQGNISITEFDGVSCIELKQTQDYVIYIYMQDGELRELWTKEGAKVTSADGQKILQLKSISFTMCKSDILLVECEDMYGNKEQVYISVRSETEGVSS